LIWKRAYQKRASSQVRYAPRELNMSDPQVPSVEERLQHCLVLAAALRRCVLLVDEHPRFSIAGFTPNEILKILPGAMTALRIELEAIAKALPAPCQNIDAPITGGAR
jgi:hypothetical protein